MRRAVVLIEDDRCTSLITYERGLHFGCEHFPSRVVEADAVDLVPAGFHDLIYPGHRKCPGVTLLGIRKLSRFGIPQLHPPKPPRLVVPRDTLHGRTQCGSRRVWH